MGSITLCTDFPERSTIKSRIRPSKVSSNLFLAIQTWCISPILTIRKGNIIFIYLTFPRKMSYSNCWEYTKASIYRNILEYSWTVGIFWRRIAHVSMQKRFFTTGYEHCMKWHIRSSSIHSWDGCERLCLGKSVGIPSMRVMGVLMEW